LLVAINTGFLKEEEVNEEFLFTVGLNNEMYQNRLVIDSDNES